MQAYKISVDKGPLTVETLKKAEKEISSFCQRQRFPDKVSRGNHNLKRNSPLYKLEPALQDGLLRVGGRPSKSSMPAEAMHPAIIPKDSHIYSDTEWLQPDKPPFAHVSFDYFGLFMVKRERSDIKRNVVLFTCLTTKAVHIEVAHTLDTDSCLNAICRFMCRRGQVSIIHSDNGTNFDAAERFWSPI